MIRSLPSVVPLLFNTDHRHNMQILAKTQQTHWYKYCSGKKLFVNPCTKREVNLRKKKIGAVLSVCYFSCLLLTVDWLSQDQM